MLSIRAVTVADYYQHGGDGPATAGGAVLWDIYIYIVALNNVSGAARIKRKKKNLEKIKWKKQNFEKN